MEKYINELETKAEALKQKVFAQLSAVEIPTEQTSTATDFGSANSSKFEKTASAIKYLLVGGGALTVASSFFNCESTLRKVLIVGVGIAELATGAVALLKPDVFDNIGNCTQSSANQSSAPTETIDFGTAKNKLVDVLLKIQDDVPSEWDSFLGKQKPYLLQYIANLQLDTSAKAKLNDIAVRRSTIKQVTGNIVGEISKLPADAASYKQYISDFQKKIFASIDTALDEQKRTATEISAEKR